MSVLDQIKSKSVKSQEKFGFTVKDGREQIPFGPFDTTEAANKTRQALIDSGLTVSDTHVLWTVATARALATVRRAAMTPPAEAKQPEAGRKAS